MAAAHLDLAHAQPLAGHDLRVAGPHGAHCDEERGPELQGQDRAIRPAPAPLAHARAAFRINASTFANWKERPQEVSMILDRLNEIERQVPGLKERIALGIVGYLVMVADDESCDAETSALLWDLVSACQPAEMTQMLNFA